MSWQWQFDMIKVLWCSFQQCWGTFIMLLVEKHDFLDIYRSTFSECVISEIQYLWGSSFFSKYLKFLVNFKNTAKNWEKVFCSWDNSIWIGIVKLSLLRRRYFSIRETFSNSINLAVINKYDKGAVLPISTVLGRVYHVACRRNVWNGTF